MIKVKELEGKDLEITKLKEELKAVQRAYAGSINAKKVREFQLLDEIKELKERTLWQRIMNRG